MAVRDAMQWPTNVHSQDIGQMQQRAVWDTPVYPVVPRIPALYSWFIALPLCSAILLTPTLAMAAVTTNFTANSGNATTSTMSLAISSCKRVIFSYPRLA